MNNTADVLIWRRGRGFLSWKFSYLTGNSPGWYHMAKRYMYRLTIDHEYPDKPIWLGRFDKGEWVNTEGLYEPIVTHLPGYNIVPDRVATGRKRFARIERCKSIIRKVPVR